MLGGAMQSGLVWDRVRARHLTAATEGQRNVGGRAVVCRSRDGRPGRSGTRATSAATASGGAVHHRLGIHVSTSFEKQTHSGEHTFFSAIAPARDASAVI